MLLVAALVFLVLRQVMPIAGGLAGGVSLSSFGLVSRSIGLGLRSARQPAARGAALHVARGVSVPFRAVGRMLRPFIQPVRSELVQSGQHVDRSAGTEALGRSWRDPRP
jgi:hypothetical protein